MIKRRDDYTENTMITNRRRCVRCSLRLRLAAGSILNGICPTIVYGSSHTSFPP